MIFSLDRTVAPTAYPVSLPEVKANARVDESAEDALILSYVAAAVDYLDGPRGILGRALLTQTWEAKLSDFSLPIWLPLYPVQSISSIQYYDEDNALQTWASSNYRLAASHYETRIDLTENSTFPTVYNRPDAITITAVAGYGDSAADVPEDVRLAILLMASHFVDNRMATTPDRIEHTPLAFHTLTSRERHPKGFF